jgi:hypothetical protein
LIRAPLSTTSVLDESAEVVKLTATPWVALLVATSLPWRFLQMMLIDEAWGLGAKAGEYGNLLRITAWWTLAAFFLGLWGRAVYARACRLAAARGETPGREALRVAPAALVNFAFIDSIAELATWLSFFTLLGPLLAFVLAGLGIGAMELNERPGIRNALKPIVRYGREVKVVVALLLVFICAFIIALVNLAAIFALGRWIAVTTGLFDMPRWSLLLSSANRRYVLMLIAGAILAVEPFWIAANVTLVRKAGAQESGDDLRVWFEELQRS